MCIVFINVPVHRYLLMYYNTVHVHLFLIVPLPHALMLHAVNQPHNDSSKGTTLFEFQDSEPPVYRHIPRQPGGCPLITAYHGNYLVVRYSDGPPIKEKERSKGRASSTLRTVRFITVPQSH